MSYIGVPPFGNTVRSVTNETATASQTTFNIVGGYVPGYVDVFLNGVLLIPGTDFTATNGLTVVLATGATAGDEFQALSYQTISFTDVYTTSQVDALIPTATSDLTNDSGFLTSIEGFSVTSGTLGTANVTTVDLGNWTITESAGVLYFATGGTNKMKLDASGNLTIVGNVTAYGTV